MDQNRSQSHRSTRASLLPTGSTFPASLGGYKQKSLVLEAALNEYVKMREGGAQVDIHAFCERFPDYRKSIRRMIEIEELLPAGEEAIDDAWPKLGSTFLGFNLLEMLGSGSIAKVYLASEVQLGGRLVALKVSHYGGFEAETLGKLRHPNIVEVYSVQRDEKSGLTAVCMPYQGSATLSDVLDVVYREKRPQQPAKIIADVALRLAIAETQPNEETAKPDHVLESGTFVDGVVHLGIQLAAALQYAHDRRILHRDLKPSNVLLTPQGRPMLLDFNLAYDAAINFNPGGGTLPYAAPEQLRETAPMMAIDETTLDVRADIFSLGVILYELLTGELPFGAPPPNIGPKQAIQIQLEALEKTPRPIRSLNKEVNAELAKVIHKALETDPARRYSTAAELEKALKSYFRPIRKAKRWIVKHPGVIALILGIVLFGSVSAAAYVATRPPYHEVQLKLAKASLEKKDLSAAIDHLTNAIESKPEDADLRMWRGQAHLHLHEYDAAVEDFEAANQLGLNSEELNDSWGYAHFQLGQFDKARFAYQRAVQANRDNTSLHIKSGYSLFKLKGIIPEEDISNAMNKDKEEFEALFLRAVCGFQRARTLTDKKSARRREMAISAAAEDMRTAAKRQPQHGLGVFEYFATVIIAAASESNSDLQPEVEAHLKAALELGVSAKQLSTNLELGPWRKESWFKNKVEQDESRPADINEMLDRYWIVRPAFPTIP